MTGFIFPASTSSLRKSKSSLWSFGDPSSTERYFPFGVSAVMPSHCFPASMCTWNPPRNLAARNFEQIDARPPRCYHRLVLLGATRAVPHYSFISGIYLFLLFFYCFFFP